MPQTNDLFLREDLAKSENRVNVALFGMMQQDWFREWFLGKLDLPTDAIVYPPKTWKGYRPDLKVKSHDGSTLAWIEVELGKDKAQLDRYREAFCEPVKTVWGRRGSGGDLSLEEISKYLGGRLQTGLLQQAAVNAEYLVKLIEEGSRLKRYTQSYRRAPLSDAMRKHPLVIGLCERLVDRLKFELRNSPPQIGHLKVDTTTGENNQGFSLRVYSAKAGGRTLSVMHISAGRPKVYFPSLLKLKKYLPEHGAEVGAYASVIASMDLDIGKYSELQTPWLPLDTVLANLDDIAPCLQALADRPASE